MSLAAVLFRKTGCPGTIPVRNKLCTKHIQNEFLLGWYKLTYFWTKTSLWYG